MARFPVAQGLGGIREGREGGVGTKQLPPSVVLNILQYPASGADDTPRFTAALTAALALPGNQSVRIRVPAVSGGYNCATWPVGGLVWSDRCIVWEGDGAGINSLTGTLLKIVAGSKGFNPKNGSNGFGARSGLRGIHLLNTDAGPGSNQGLLMQCSEGWLDDVVVEGFGGHGVHVLSGIGSSDGTINTNLFRFRHLRVVSNKSDGLHIEGLDSNAGLIDGLDATTNTGWGCYDLAVLVNTWIAPHFANNVAGDWRAGANALNKRVFGAYFEDANTFAVQFESTASGCFVDAAQLGNKPSGGATRINNLNTNIGQNVVQQSIFGYPFLNDVIIGNNQTGRSITLSDEQKRITLLAGASALIQSPDAGTYWTDQTLNGGDRYVAPNAAGGSFRIDVAPLRIGNLFVYGGSGAPTTRPGALNPVAGDFYLRLDTPTVANQRIYVCTVGGGSPTWVPLADSVSAASAALTYSASITPDNSQSGILTLSVTNGTAFTMNAPALSRGQLTFSINNASGGAMGAITWNATYKLAGAFVNPANTKTRTITFFYDGTNWTELSRAAADI